MSRFTIYIPKEFESSFRSFVEGQRTPSRRICSLVKGDIDNLNIPLLREMLKNPSQFRKVKELVKEIENI